MDYTICHYEKSDYIFLGTLSDDEYKGYHVSIAKSMRQANDTYEKCFVATVDNEIVAYIYGFIVPTKVTLPQFLHVKETQRGKGIGAALLNHFECVHVHSFITETNCTIITLNRDMKQEQQKLQ